MPAYTALLQKPLETISWEDDNSIEELLQVVQLFRPFSVAITEFIMDHGYNGDDSDVEAKVAFIKSAFAGANMDAPREIREWFTAGQPIKRDTAFLICFAFSLDGNETDEFFRRYYDFSNMTYPRANYQDALFRELTLFFHKTLASYHGDRYQDAAEAIEQLKIILALADETKPYLISTPVPAPVFFTGRENELEALSHLLHTPGQHTFNLYGMGGIGKSTLARAWLGIHRNEYDAVLWLYDQGKTVELLCDDLTIHVNTVQQMKEEPLEEYLERKLRTLTEIVSRQHTLVVMDNVVPEHLEDLQPLLNVGWDVLLISRAALAEGLYPSFCVEELKPNALAHLFVRYAYAEISSEDDARDFETIANTVYGHTLTMELLGRQIARSYLTIHEAAEMVEQAGFRALPGEKIDYIHDQQAFMAPLTKILDQLVEIDQFTEEEKQLLQILTVVELPGIRVSLLRELTSSAMIETIHCLESCGWLVVEAQRIVLHPLMREYIHTWLWTEETRQTLDGILVRLHHIINPNEEQPDLDKQFPSDYRALYELLSISEQLLRYAIPGSPASQILAFRILMDAPVDVDEKVLDRMLKMLARPDYLDERCVLRMYETSAFLLARLEYYQDAHDMLKSMKVYLKKHPSHYYTSWYRYRLLRSPCGDSSMNEVRGGLLTAFASWA